MDKDADRIDILKFQFGRIINVIHALREMGIKEPETLVHSYLAENKEVDHG